MSRARTDPTPPILPSVPPPTPSASQRPRRPYDERATRIQQARFLNLLEQQVFVDQLILEVDQLLDRLQPPMNGKINLRFIRGGGEYRPVAVKWQAVSPDRQPATARKPWLATQLAQNPPLAQQFRARHNNRWAVSAEDRRGIRAALTLAARVLAFRRELGRERAHILARITYSTRRFLRQMAVFRERIKVLNARVDLDWAQPDQALAKLRIRQVERSARTTDAARAQAQRRAERRKLRQKRA